VISCPIHWRGKDLRRYHNVPEKDARMPDFVVDLLFWIAVFVALFLVVRYFQARKKDKDE